MEAQKEYKLAVKDIERLTDVKGVQYIGIRGYKNKFGEVSNQRINAGISQKALHEEALTLYAALETDVAKWSVLCKDHGNETVIKNLMTLRQSSTTCISGTNTRSQAMKDAFLPITKGLKLCINTRQLMVYGHVESKTVIVPGVYPEVAHRKDTLCKNAIKKAAGVRIDDYRQFILEIDNLDSIRVAGKEIEIPISQAA